MSSEANVDEWAFLYQMEEIAWDALRRDGMTDDEIFSQMSHVTDCFLRDGMTDLKQNDLFALALAHIYVLYECINDDDFSQSLAEWIWDGSLIAMLMMSAGDQNIVVKSFRERQSRISSGPKNRFSLPNELVHHVLSQAGPSDKTFTYFREYIGSERRLRLNSGTYELTCVENERGNPIAYIAENVAVSSESGEGRVQIPVSTLTSAVSRHNRR